MTSAVGWPCMDTGWAIIGSVRSRRRHPRYDSPVGHQRSIARKWTDVSRPGRRGVLAEIQRLVVRMAGDNPTWGLHADPRRAEERGASGQSVDDRAVLGLRIEFKGRDSLRQRAPRRPQLVTTFHQGQGLSVNVSKTLSRSAKTILAPGFEFRHLLRTGCARATAPRDASSCLVTRALRSGGTRSRPYLLDQMLRQGLETREFVLPRIWTAVSPVFRVTTTNRGP